MTRRPAVFRVAVPGTVLAALAVVFAIAWGTEPGAAPAAAQGAGSAVVTSITRACPPAAPGSANPQVSMIALPSPGSASASTTAQPTGSATVSALLSTPPATSGKTSSVTITAPGKDVTMTVPGSGAAVTATGRMAEGFEAEQTDASGTGVASCTHPGSDMWFVGTGEADGASQVWLYLTNTSNVTASADVTILTDTGQRSGLASAITVPPDQSVAENVTPYVRGSQAIALHVQAGAGQLAAWAWEGGPGGGAWLPQANAPATTLVVPGLTVASTAAKLFVVVPGENDAQVTVTAYTPAGASAQFPAGAAEATAGAATPFVLSSLGASAAGLKLTSNVPIVAGALVPGSAAGIGSFTTAAAPITQQGVVAGNPAAEGLTVGLLLTAPSAGAKASISEVSADGTVTIPADERNVTVAAGHTLGVQVPGPSDTGGRPFAIVVTPQPGSGPLYAARLVTSGAGGLSAPLSSLLPVPSAMTSFPLPPARDSYTAVLPG